MSIVSSAGGTWATASFRRPSTSQNGTWGNSPARRAPWFCARKTAPGAESFACRAYLTQGVRACAGPLHLFRAQGVASGAGAQKESGAPPERKSVRELHGKTRTWSTISSWKWLSGATAYQRRRIAAVRRLF